MTDSRQLLADYATTGSEAAFRELVSRYIDLVYSTAFRLVDGDAHRAQDVAQTVFLDLSRQATKLTGTVMLGGWLHRHTCYVARKTLRGERRRQDRERQAAEMNALNNPPDNGFEQFAPVLDEVINELGEEDRKAILLRFYERLDLRSVGEVLGASENAAQKRVSRALDQLQVLLKRRGVALSAAALGTTLAGQAVSAAPAGLAAGIAGTVLASSAAGMATMSALTKILMITKAKLAIFGALLVTAIATPMLVQHQTQVRLRNENVLLRQQVEQLAPLRAENERLSNVVAEAGNEPPVAGDQTSELLRLRGEVGRLRQENQEISRLREQVRQSHAAPGGSATDADALVDYLGAAVPPPANLDPAYTKDGLLNAIQTAANNAGVSLKQVQTDDSEFPCLLGVVSAPGDWEKLKAQLRKLNGYEYYGAVGSDTYNAFSITPSRAFPPGSSQSIFRRTNVRMQLLADRLNGTRGP